MSNGKERELQGQWEVKDRGPYHPVAFDEVCERFMAEIRINNKRLTQIEAVISPLMARISCECTDEEALTLVRMATAKAQEVVKEYGVHDDAWQTWLDSQRKQGKL